MSTTTSAKKKIFYRNRDGYMYLLPTIIVLCSVFLVPLVLSLILSFMDWNYLDLNSTPKLVGFRNYVDIFENPYDMDSFRITGIFVLASVSIEMILGIIIALLLNTKRHGVKLFRTVVLMPMLVSDVVVALCWRYILQPDFGILNSVLKAIGASPVMWTDSSHALMTIIFVEIWQHTGFVVMMILSGLQGVPTDLEEAALVDGANYFQRLIKIIIPYIKPWVLTGGGPANKTAVLGISIYKYGFRYYEMGLGNAFAWLMIIGSIAIVVAYIGMMKEDEGL